MAEYLIQDTTLNAIADAINAKTGGSSAMTPAQMVTEIGSIPSGGLGDFELVDTITVSEAVTQLSITVPEWAKQLYVRLNTTDSASNKPAVYHSYVATSRKLCDLATGATHGGDVIVFWATVDANNIGKDITGGAYSNKPGLTVPYAKPASILYSAGSSATFTGTFTVYGRR